MIALDIIRIAVGLVFSLFLPGFLLNLLMFKKQDVNERIALSFVFSIVILTILGFSLGFQSIADLTGGITKSNLYISLLIINLVLGITCLIKKRRVDYIERGGIYQNKTLFGLTIAGSLLIPLYAALLNLYDLPTWIFHFLYIANIFLISYTVLFGKLNANKKLFLILLYIICLQLIIPIRIPNEIISNYPDSNYEYQIVKNIIETGTINLDFGTVQAVDYVYHPTLEIITAITSLVSAINPEILLKYFGIFLNVITLFFLYKFFRKYFNEEISLMSLLIAGSCFRFVYFHSFTIHQSLGLMFVAIFLFYLNQVGLWNRVILIISALFIVVSHFFTNIIFIALLGFYIIYRLMQKIWIGENKKVEIYGMGILIALTLIWGLVIAQPLYTDLYTIGMKTTENLKPEVTYEVTYGENVTLPEGYTLTEKEVEEIQQVMGDQVQVKKSYGFKSFNLILISQGLKNLKNDISRLIGDISVLAFGVLMVIGLAIFITKKELRDSKLIPWALAAITLFILFTIIWSFGFRDIKDLYPRIFIYVYFLTAPFAAFIITKLVVLDKKGIEIISFLLFGLILMNSLYYAYDDFYYESREYGNSLLSYKQAGYFSDTNLKEEMLWGDEMSRSLIGAYGEKTVYLYPMSTKIADYIDRDLDKDMFIVIPADIYTNQIYKRNPKEEINTVIEDNDIIYNANDVRITRLN